MIAELAKIRATPMTDDNTKTAIEAELVAEADFQAAIEAEVKEVEASAAKRIAAIRARKRK